MSRLYETFRGERGDTIIEAMVVLAVLGLALAITYATVNRSLTGTQVSQESTQAVNLLQTQVESIKAYSETDPTDPNYLFSLSLPTSFCVSGGAIYSNPSGTPDLNSGTGNFDAKCTIDVNGNGQPYYVSITHPNPPSGGNHTFTATAQWYDAQGRGVDSATLVYRLYQ